MWYEWGTQEDFDTWHNAKIQELNLPAPAINQATGEVNPFAQVTTAYTTPHLVDNKVIAIVDDEHSQGLTPTSLRLPEPTVPSRGIQQ